MAKIIDLTGKEFGYWKVIERVENAKSGQPMWLCECRCGKRKKIAGCRLRTGKSKSCGCGYVKKGRPIKEGKNKKLYEVWKAMRKRICNKRSKAYKNYGGRGIGICEEWDKDFEAFYQWAIKNGYKEGLSIDRKDNDKGYSPDNCRWVTRKVQCNNTRRNRRITYGGETHTIREWEDILHLGENVLRMRLNNGWDIERAMRTEQKN